MKKYLVLLILCFLTASLQSQNKEKEFYISLKLYKHLYNKPLSSKDSLSFNVVNNDTLVLIKDKTRFEKLISENSNKKNGGISYYTTESKTYMSLNQYKKRYKKEITEEDIANFKINNGDTLILISNKDFYKNRVRVPYEPKDSTFLEIYKDVVFNKYHRNNANNDLRMRLWKDSLNIFFTDNVNKKVKEEIKAFGQHLSKNIDSLHIKFVDSVEKSNYLIYGLNSDTDYNYNSQIKPKKVSYYIYWNNKQQIYKADLQIDTRTYKNESELITASKIVFLGSLGYFKYSFKLPKESYFSEKYSNEKTFTDLDLEILKYHYSYGICKGTDLKTFEEQHERGKEALKKGRKHFFVHQN